MNPHYFTYLARLAEDGRLCARWQLRDRHGALLCEPNGSLTRHAWEETAKLLPSARALSSVKLIGEYNSLTLEADFLHVLQSDPVLAEFFVKDKHEHLLRKNLRYVCNYPEIAQHLSVLNSYLPEAFRRSVFCAWFATLIYLDADTLDEDVRNIFFSALCHDLGLLHIAPELVNTSTDKNSEEYYEHVKKSMNLISKLPGVTRDSIRSVAEHHEHLDSSGHPRGLGSNQLSHGGQYIHLLNNLFDLYNQHFKPKGKSLADTIPIVEMNSISHFGYTAKATIELLKRGSRTEGTLIPPEVLGSLVDDIKTRYSYILFANEIIQTFTKSVGFRHDDMALFMLQNSMIHVALTLDKSQLLNSAYMRWLDHVLEFDIKREHHLIEISYLMANEVLYHIEKFRNRLFLYKRFCKINHVRKHADEALKKFKTRALPRKDN